MIPFPSFPSFAFSCSCDLHFGHAAALAPINKSGAGSKTPHPRSAEDQAQSDPSRVQLQLQLRLQSQVEASARRQWNVYFPHISRHCDLDGLADWRTGGRANVHTNVLQLSRQVKLQIYECQKGGGPPPFFHSMGVFIYVHIYIFLRLFLFFNHLWDVRCEYLWGWLGTRHAAIQKPINMLRVKVKSLLVLCGLKLKLQKTKERHVSDFLIKEKSSIRFDGQVRVLKACR